MSARKLFVEVIINTRKAAGNVKLLRNSVNLLKSTLTALFRTGSIALIFGGLRSVIGMMTELKESVKRVTNELIQLNLEGMKTAAVLTKGESGTGGVYEQVSELARSASTEVGRTAKEIQSGLYTAALAGNNVEEAYGLTDSAMKMATIAGSDFNSTIDGLIGVSRAFGVETQNIPKLADTITASFTNSKMSLDGFFTAMSYVAPIAGTVFGKSEETIRDTSAALMSLTDQGFSFSKAGVYLRGTLNKLSGGTSKAATMFAKYGVNIYDADADNQRFLDTLLKGQRALSGHYDELDRLKNKQFEIALAGGEGSDAFLAVGDSIDKTNSKISSLSGGLDKVFKQFTLSGGKMKPLTEVLGMMSEKIPTEVVSRTFGVRGGMGAAALLGNPELYNKKNDILQQSMEASDQGSSILGKMFEQVVNTFATTWGRITSTITASLQVVFDPFIRVANTLFSTLQLGLESFYKSLESNKGVFKVWAASIGKALEPVFSNAALNLAGLGTKIGKTFMPGQSVDYSMYKFDQGKITSDKVTSSGSVSEKIGLMAKSMSSMFIAHLQSMLSTLKPVFETLAGVIGESFMTYLKSKMEVFKSFGMAMGKAMADAALSAWNNRDKAVYKDSSGNVQVNQGKLKNLSKGSWLDMIPGVGLASLMDKKSQLDLLNQGVLEGTLNQKSTTNMGGGSSSIGFGSMGSMFDSTFGDVNKSLNNTLSSSKPSLNTPSRGNPSGTKGTGWLQFDGGSKVDMSSFQKNASKAANSMSWFGSDGTKHMITLADAAKKSQENFAREQVRVDNLLRSVHQSGVNSGGGG